ncbi:16S rRNA (cytosine(967)-C(5))-methyltransferase RsmB [Paludicola sp. MB14-C6]|uniref:16S rRNA (cytosine(967)-C(5))-methyltransferase RsmB n=1 Tax=Paludihabitans sp. MB14-C6 TaxID=3070656 RepID=UPI0027DBA5B5|nr:16S rRNA (cytosine(967)-C(5))-methyltransferase RsmB [Paludicola sp. MB14-C6]WMJ22380.1 16S rRNA (cytosine(967)-C(5))-methyltransferase RsmB [Paludicola sp. MB14-C6]
MKTARQIAYDTLLRIEKENAYSNIAIDKMLQSSGLDKVQSAFATAIFYGVLETKIQLDYAISKYLKKKLTSLDIQIVTILRMGFYQLLYMDGVPDNAAVNESVKLVEYARKASAKGFANAVLRSFIRDEKAITLPNKDKDLVMYYSIQYACPKWLFQQWKDQYDLETAIELAKASLHRPPLTVRVNTLKTTTEKLIGFLENRGVKACKHEFLENCLVLEQTGSIDKLPQYRQGLFHVQDVASQICAEILNAKQGDTIIDMCSAPGSKAFTIAEHMNNEGKIYAFDLFEHKLKLISDGAKRLGITIMNTSLQDATIFNEDLLKADHVLCDVPCSGLGIVRRKPEIKYKNEQDFANLPEIQFAILSNAANYVKLGGTLVYSTCTTNKKENIEVINRFLKMNNSFKPLQLSEIFGKINGMDDFAVTLFPHKYNCDGFFIAALVKEKESV